MIERVAIAFLVFAMFTSLTAQDQTFIRLGPALGYRHFSATIAADVGGGIMSTRQASGLMPAVSASAGALFDLSPQLSLRVDGEALWSKSTLTDRFTVPIVVEQQLTTGTIRRDHAIEAAMMIADAGLVWKPAELVHLSLLAGLVFPPTLSVAVTETFEQPAGATFVSSGSSSRSLGSGQLANGPASSYGTLAIQAARILPLNHTWSLAAYARGRVAFTSAVANGSWYPWEIGVGVDVYFTLPSTDGIQTIERVLVDVRRLVADTATIVDPFHVDRRDTVWTRVEEQRADTLYGTEVDTLMITTLRHEVRHIPGPPPFLSTILDVIADADAVDTLAAVWVSVECVSDTTTSTIASIVMDDVVIWRESFTGPHLERTIVLSSVIPEITERSAILLTATAVTTDAVGQVREAVPKHITLRRTRAGSTLQGGR